jgi:small subunit ribosomal protein S16
MLAIRLRRTGTTKKPFYRVVVADSRSWRDGKFVEIVGHYDSRSNPHKVTLNEERVAYWMSKGAQPSDTVKSLIKKTRKAAGSPTGADASASTAKKKSQKKAA